MNRKIRFSKIGLAVIFACLFVVGFGCAGMKKTDAQQASVAIAPPAGVKGTAIIINGAGFHPEEEIDIVLTLGPGERIGLGTAKLDAIMADSNGIFTAESVIPVFAKPGSYDVEVEGNKGNIVNTTLEVTPE